MAYRSNTRLSSIGVTCIRVSTASRIIRALHCLRHERRISDASTCPVPVVALFTLRHLESSPAVLQHTHTHKNVLFARATLNENPLQSSRQSCTPCRWVRMRMPEAQRKPYRTSGCNQILTNSQIRNSFPKRQRMPSIYYRTASSATFMRTHDNALCVFFLSRAHQGRKGSISYTILYRMHTATSARDCSEEVVYMKCAEHMNNGIEPYFTGDLSSVTHLGWSWCCRTRSPSSMCGTKSI